MLQPEGTQKSIGRERGLVLAKQLGQDEQGLLQGDGMVQWHL